MSKKYSIRNGRELTETQYKIYLEGLAEGIWRTKVELGDGDLHSKFSDPLFVDTLNNVYSYVFDFHDGGRHHKFKSLDELYEALIKKIKL